MIHAARTRKNYETVAAHTCSKRKNLGAFACENSLRRPVESIDKAWQARASSFFSIRDEATRFANDRTKIHCCASFGGASAEVDSVD